MMPNRRFLGLSLGAASFFYQASPSNMDKLLALLFLPRLLA